MSVWYGDNPNCGRCGHLNSRGFCSMTACIYPCETGMGGYINKPQTNADRIRQMSDEELAIEETAKGGCPHDCETPDDLDTDCVRCWLDWLKQEVDNV